ncbi:hypothetical protein BKA93DRAFT_770420 [Sparassis latifolia]
MPTSVWTTRLGLAWSSMLYCQISVPTYPVDSNDGINYGSVACVTSRNMRSTSLMQVMYMLNIYSRMTENLVLRGSQGSWGRIVRRILRCICNYICCTDTCATARSRHSGRILDVLVRL